MNDDEDPWLSPAQFRCLQAGLRVVGNWVADDHDPDIALRRALNDEPAPIDVVIGLATVSRLLAIELAAATGATETEVLTRLTATVNQLQGVVRRRV